MIHCNKDDSQEASSQTPFLPLGFVFTTLYICLTIYSGGDDESMDGDVNKYLVLAIIGVVNCTPNVGHNLTSEGAVY
ncbi:hypothetical protein, partial [Escherichia coli]|uniref:hypothetical protein n=1 Tax=Escherichia coli TaxID=562 RepID=UPI001BDB9EFA